MNFVKNETFKIVNFGQIEFFSCKTFSGRFLSSEQKNNLVFKSIKLTSFPRHRGVKSSQ